MNQVVTPKALTPEEGLALLRAPFAENQISKMCRSTKKDNPKSKCVRCDGYHGQPSIQLEYVGHAALTDRLLAADPTWTWEPVALNAQGLPLLDQHGGLWIKLTVCGVTRLGYGDATNKIGSEGIKEIIGDALRNAAMRFGAALELWHKGDLHGDEDGAEPQKQETKQEGPPPYPQDRLTKNLPAWKKAIQDGTQTPERIITFISSQYRLSEEQKKSINEIAAPKAGARTTTEAR